MVIVSASMPRSASRYFYFLTNDLLQLAGYPNVYSIREKYHTNLFRSVKWYDWVKWYDYRQVSKIAQAGGKDTFAIRTHKRPNTALRYFLKTGRFKATYIYRDPRDVILSTFEIGAKFRESGNTDRYFRIGPYKGFARFHTFKGTVSWFKMQIFPRWKKWIRMPNTLTTKYENLVTDPFLHLKKLAQFLEISVPDEGMREIIQKYEPDSTGKRPEYRTGGGGKVFNRGIIGRYKTELSLEQQEFCSKHLHKCLEEMGYVP